MGLKVFNGCYDGRHEVVVAAPSKKAAHAAVAAIWRVGYYSWNQYTSETGNDEDIAVAMAKPLAVFSRRLNRIGEYVEVLPTPPAAAKEE